MLFRSAQGLRPILRLLSGTPRCRGPLNSNVRHHKIPPSSLVQLEYSIAVPEDSAECVSLRGKTRQNAVSEARLRSIGITVETWARDIRTGNLLGHVCRQNRKMIGYCFGSRQDGEIVVLALLPEFEGLGIGKELLARVIRELAALGHTRQFLGCSPDAQNRSHGFYRHLGWRPTGNFDKHGDEILELKFRLIGSAPVMPNPSLKGSTNGGPPGPVWWYTVHFHQPGPGVLPSSPP